MFTLVRILPQIPTGSLQPNALQITGTWICPGVLAAASQVELRLTSPASAPVGTVFTATASTGQTGQPPSGSVEWTIPAWPGLTCSQKIAFEVRGECGGQMTPWASMGTAEVNCGVGCPRFSVSAPTYAPCSGNPATQSVTLTATVMMNQGVSQAFEWDFGDGQSSAVQTVTSTGTNSPITLTATHTYADQATPYLACLRAVNQECPPVCVSVQTNCSDTGCPVVTPSVSYGACTASGTVPVTYTLAFNPPLAQGALASAVVNYGAMIAGASGSPQLVNTANGPVGSVQHTVNLPHRSGGYLSTATVNVIAGGQFCPVASPSIQVDPPACINCPDPARPVTLIVTVPTSDPAWCAPAAAPLAAGLTTQINWLAPAPANPPVPVRYDWVITAPGGGQTATRSSTTATVSTSSGWIGTGSLAGGALNLAAAGTYAASVSVVFGANAGLPTDASGAITCSLTGSASFALAPCDGRTTCPVLTGLATNVGCVQSDGTAAVVSVTASVDDPAGSAQTFEWDFGDPGSQGNQIATATANATHSYAAAGSYTIAVRLRSSDPRCPNPASVFSRTITVADCATPPPPPPNDRSTSGCAALLWASLIAMLVGGLMLIIGCLIATLVTGGQMAGIIVSIIGGIILLIGIVLFVIWALICSALTACSVLRAAIVFVTALIVIFGVISAVIAIISIFVTVSWPCAFAAAANWGGWGVILAVLTEIERRINCMIPGPGPGGAASSSSPLTSSAQRSAAPGRTFGSSLGGRLGLGDRVGLVTSAMGIQPCEGCARRAAQLNALVPARSP